LVCNSASTAAPAPGTVWHGTYAHGRRGDVERQHRHARRRHRDARGLGGGCGGNWVHVSVVVALWAVTSVTPDKLTSVACRLGFGSSITLNYPGVVK
jgi:hypothetical protein